VVNGPVFNELSGEQARQAIDARQVFESLEAARLEAKTRFAGSMSWKAIGGAAYLYRTRHRVSKSLGVRSAETEAVYRSFKDGQAAVEGRVASLTAQLERMAPFVRAHGLGRVPSTLARILRRLDRAGTRYPRTVVMGSDALFAYEARAAVILEPGYLPTLVRNGKQSKNAVPLDDDIGVAELWKLRWIVEAPRFSEIVFAEDGLPLRLDVPDPRWFAAHKFWLAGRDDRNPLKKRRDLAQAEMVATLIGRYMPLLATDEAAVASLPADLRAWLRGAVERGSGPKAVW